MENEKNVTLIGRVGKNPQYVYYMDSQQSEIKASFVSNSAKHKDQWFDLRIKNDKAEENKFSFQSGTKIEITGNIVVEQKENKDVNKFYAEKISLFQKMQIDARITAIDVKEANNLTELKVVSSEVVKGEENQKWSTITLFNDKQKLAEGLKVNDQITIAGEAKLEKNIKNGKEYENTKFINPIAIGSKEKVQEILKTMSETKQTEQTTDQKPSPSVSQTPQRNPTPRNRGASIAN